jgi:hypothetical protein
VVLNHPGGRPLRAWAVLGALGGDAPAAPDPGGAAPR